MLEFIENRRPQKGFRSVSVHVNNIPRGFLFYVKNGGWTFSPILCSYLGISHKIAETFSRLDDAKENVGRLLAEREVSNEAS